MAFLTYFTIVILLSLRANIYVLKNEPMMESVMDTNRVSGGHVTVQTFLFTKEAFLYCIYR